MDKNKVIYRHIELIKQSDNSQIVWWSICLTICVIGYSMFIAPALTQETCAFVSILFICGFFAVLTILTMIIPAPDDEGGDVNE